jgi:hypothetical protein
MPAQLSDKEEVTALLHARMAVQTDALERRDHTPQPTALVNEILELRCCGGLNVEETAGSLGVSVEAVARDSRTATLWLRRDFACEARA